MLRHSCGYALAKRGYELRVLQASLGQRAAKHPTRYPRTAAHRFEGLWEEASGDGPVPQHAIPAAVAGIVESRGDCPKGTSRATSKAARRSHGTPPLGKAGICLRARRFGS